MRIQTIHRNQMGDVLNECSAQGFQITTADGGRITIMVDGDRLARAEPPSAPVVGGLIEAAKAAESMLRTVHECASHDCEDCREHAGIHAKHLRDALAQQPAAEPKTLPVPTRVYLIGETAVIAGTPQRGWDEEGPDAHNCDDMGCSTFGRHVLARVPFTDERALPTQQGGGEINMDVTVRDGAWVGTYAEWCRRKQPTAAQQQGGAE